MFNKLTEQLKNNPRTIVFTEGTDARILDAASKLSTGGILSVILLGEEAAVKRPRRMADLTSVSARSSILSSMMRWTPWWMRW